MFSWVFPVRPIMVPDTMLQDITGDLTGIGITAVPTGGTGTGGITAGTGIRAPPLARRTEPD